MNIVLKAFLIALSPFMVAGLIVLGASYYPTVTIICIFIACLFIVFVFLFAGIYVELKQSEFYRKKLKKKRVKAGTIYL